MADAKISVHAPVTSVTSITRNDADLFASNSDGTLFACGTSDDLNNMVHLFELNTLDDMESDNKNYYVSTIAATHHEHGGILSMLFYQNNQSRNIITGSNEGAVQVFQLGKSTNNQGDDGISYELKRNINISLLSNKSYDKIAVTGLTMIGDEHTIAISEDGGIHQFDLAREGAKVQSRNEYSPLYDVCAHSSSSFVTAGLNQIKLWDMKSNTSAIELSCTLRRAWMNPGDDSTYASILPTVAFSVAVHPSRPEYLASGNGTGVISLWDLRQPSKPLESLGHSNHVISSIVFDSITASMYASSLGGWVASYNYMDYFMGGGESGKKTEPFNLYSSTSAMNSISFDSRTKVLATASDDCTLKFFDLQS